MWCFMSCWSVPSSRKKNIFEDLFHVMHPSTKYSWIKPKWNIWANHCNLWLRLRCQSIERLGADLNVVSTWIWRMLCFNGLHILCFGWEQTNKPSRTAPSLVAFCSKTLAKLMLNSFWTLLEKFDVWQVFVWLSRVESCQTKDEWCNGLILLSYLFSL